MNKRLRKKLTKKLLASPMTDNLDWAAILRSEPEKATQCPVLKKLDGVAWWWILIQQPQVAKQPNSRYLSISLLSHQLFICPLLVPLWGIYSISKRWHAHVFFSTPLSSYPGSWL